MALDYPIHCAHCGARWECPAQQAAQDDYGAFCCPTCGGKEAVTVTRSGNLGIMPAWMAAAFTLAEKEEG